MNREKYRIGNIYITIANLAEIQDAVIRSIENREKGYICVSNMRTVVVANQDDSYRDVMCGSMMNIPDGTPLVWCGKLSGCKTVQRTCGPDLFEQLLKSKNERLNHFFLGDTDETLKKLKDKVKSDFGTEVAGCYSPPFLPLEEYDLKGIAETINESGATVVWTSLRAPKQDILAAKLMPYLNDGIVVIGIGAAFRFILGEYKPPKGFLQKIGLAGLLCMRNTTVWTEIKWYFKHTAYLLYFMVQIIWRRLFLRKL